MIGAIGIVCGVYRDYLGVYIGIWAIGILEMKMETTIQSLGLLRLGIILLKFRIWSLWGPYYGLGQGYTLST